MAPLFCFILGFFLTPSNPIYSVDEVFEMAERGVLPKHFDMTYVHKTGDAHTISWTLDQSKFNPPIIINGNSSVEDNTTSINEVISFRKYNGVLKNNKDRHFALLNIYDGQTEIILSSKTIGNTFIGKKHGHKIEYSGEKDFLSRHVQHMDCSPERVDQEIPELRGGGPSSCKKVYLSITADHDLYTQMGRSIQRVSEYINTSLSIVQAIYRLEEVQLGISEIIIHTNEDRFRHITALDDLNFFRYLRRQYNGDVALCLSGYKDGTGFAPLGGHAFLSALCIKSTSYAYVNVDGSTKTFPNFSWDVFGIAHEIGHVLGSEHTHACVWGPSKNKPIDDCSAPIGGCAPGPTPKHGTIMSYCHLPGNPGVSFAEGFGKEPGDVIRAKVGNASCLSDYLPSSSQAFAPGTVHANMECNDGTFTHYYFDNNTSTEQDDILVLSINKKGQNIGHVYDGTLSISTSYTNQVGTQKGKKITAPYTAGQTFYVAQKYWTISPLQQPTTAVEVKVPFSQKDINALDASLPYQLTIDQLQLLNIKSPANPDPNSNHRNATSSRVSMYTKGTRPTGSKFQHSQSGTFHYFSHNTTTLQGGGLGVYEDLALPVEILSFNAQRKDTEVELSWEVNNEIGVHAYVVEKSSNSEEYEALDSVFAESTSDHYQYLDASNAFEGGYYRLKVVDYDGRIEYSPTRFVERLGMSNSPSEVRHPSLLSGQTLEYQTDMEIEDLRVELIHPLGTIVFTSDIRSSNGVIRLPHGITPGGYLCKWMSQKKILQTKKVVLAH